MKKAVFIIDLTVLLSALGTYVFLGLAEHRSLQVLHGQSIPGLSHLAFEYKGIVIIIALIGVCGTLIKTIKGNLKETDLILYLALAGLFISCILFVSLIAVLLPQVIFVSPLR
jgi:hypothetical protein